MTAKRNRIDCSYSDGTASVAIVAAAAIVKTGTLTMPALTAVSPMMSAPTKLTVWLIDCGARSPASRTISKSSVTQSISSIGGSGVFVLLRIPLNGNFIAALLTILGYSINDTVVIYDRIRENSALYGKKQMSLAELVNLSVNQSFARSLMTSITTCLALGVVCVVSVIYRLDSIYSFAFPLLFGMVSGVYSTICIATPLWVDWKNKKKAAKKA